MTVRPEVWLAIAGGARGLGFFPGGWTQEVGQTIAGISRDIARLGPALHSFPGRSPATSGSPQIKVGVRTYLGALYVVAVNSTRETAEATIRVPGLRGRRLTVLDEDRSLSVDGDTFSDTLVPLAVHIYIAPPPGFSASGL